MASYTCASCRAGENYNVPAEVEVRGTTYRFQERGTPYHAYLCWEHYEMMIEDGDKLIVVREL